jgi:sporulation protein YlmC with PRC-barrel domain
MEDHMKRLVIGCIFSGAVVSGAFAATTMSSAPAESWTVTNYYKQAVYDPKESKIGDVDDVLVDKAGKVTGLVIGVGGFLGAGEKDVIVPFTAVKLAKKNDKWWLTLDETKDDLKNAPGFGYDKASTTWVPEKK